MATNANLGGGNSHFFFSPRKLGNPFWLIFFQMGWNHQLEIMDRSRFVSTLKIDWFFRLESIGCYDLSPDLVEILSSIREATKNCFSQLGLFVIVFSTKSGALQFWHSCLVSGPVAHGAWIADEAWVLYGSPFIETFLRVRSVQQDICRDETRCQKLKIVKVFGISGKIWDWKIKPPLVWKPWLYQKKSVPTQQTKVISLNSALSACERADEWQVGALRYFLNTRSWFFLQKKHPCGLWGCRHLIYVTTR